MILASACPFNNLPNCKAKRLPDLIVKWTNTRNTLNILFSVHVYKQTKRNISDVGNVFANPVQVFREANIDTWRPFTLGCSPRNDARHHPVTQCVVLARQAATTVTLNIERMSSEEKL